MTQFELSILDGIQALRSPIMDFCMTVITHTGDMGLLWIGLTILLLCLPQKRKTGVILMLALLCDAILCNGILKLIFARIRPCDIKEGIELLIRHPSDYSFPSGHTAMAFTSVFALMFARERKLWLSALAWACLIAFSRLYMYVHFPTDILGGIVVGIVAGLAGNKLVQHWEKKKKEEIA